MTYEEQMNRASKLADVIKAKGHDAYVGLIGDCYLIRVCARKRGDTTPAGKWDAVVPTERCINEWLASA